MKMQHTLVCIGQWEIHQNYNKYGTLPLTRLEVCLWNQVSEGMQYVGYFEVVEGGLSEMRWKAETPDMTHDTCSEQKTVNA